MDFELSSLKNQFEHQSPSSDSSSDVINLVLINLMVNIGKLKSSICYRINFKPLGDIADSWKKISASFLVS